MTLFCVLRSVNSNDITGDAAQELAKVVLEHGLLEDFGGIPMNGLRENKVIELNLNEKGIGLPGAFVLAGLLPAASALKSCRYNRAPRGVGNLCTATWTVVCFSCTQ